MRRTKILVLFTATFMVVCGILCSIFYVAAHTQVYLTPVREISTDESVHVWVHSGKNLLWTIEE